MIFNHTIPQMLVSYGGCGEKVFLIDARLGRKVIKRVVGYLDGLFKCVFRVAFFLMLVVFYKVGKLIPIVETAP